MISTILSAINKQKVVEHRMSCAHVVTVSETANDSYALSPRQSPTRKWGGPGSMGEYVLLSHTHDELEKVLYYLAGGI